MGIRIHKALGYGMIDVQHEKYRIVDPRLNPKSLFLDDEFWERDSSAYFEWLEKNGKKENFDLCIARDLPDRERIFHRTFVYENEYGMPNVFLLTPLAMTSGNGSWHRYDDTIDWVEETDVRERDDAQVNRVHVLPHGIYPWNALYFDRRTGEKLPPDHQMLWRRRYWSVDTSDAHREEIAKALGCESFEEADRVFGSVVPDEIRDLAEYGELFVDPMGWTQLKPLLYVYWS